MGAAREWCSTCCSSRSTTTWVSFTRRGQRPPAGQQAATDPARHRFVCLCGLAQSVRRRPAREEARASCGTRRLAFGPGNDCITSSQARIPSEIIRFEIGTMQRRLAWPLRKEDTHKSRKCKQLFTSAQAEGPHPRRWPRKDASGGPAAARNPADCICLLVSKEWFKSP